MTGFGEPAEVLRVEELETPVPEPGQVRVRMLASPVNPSDVMTIRGTYGRRPSLPFTPGYEGVGVVEESGGGLLGALRRNKRVVVLNSITGNWAEQAVVPARQVIPLPASLPVETQIRQRATLPCGSGLRPIRRGLASRPSGNTPALVSAVTKRRSVASPIVVVRR